MAVLLGLGAALGYGASDFLGGFASRRSGVLPTTAVSQGAGLAVLVVVLAAVGGAPTLATLAWGSGSGVAAALALVAYFRGLAVGRMGVVAPVTGVVAAAVPVVIGILAGERPSVLAAVGIVVAVVAVGLVSLSPDPDRADAPVPGPTGVYAGPLSAAQVVARARGAAERTPGLADAVVAGVGFGLFFVLLDLAGSGGALWALTSSAASNLAVLLVIAAVRRRSLRPARGTWAITIGSGLASTAATLSFILAAGRGLVAIAAVLAALSPAATVGLARVVVGERLHRLQIVGLAAALSAAALIAAG